MRAGTMNSNVRSEDQAIRVLDDLRLSYFKIQGMPNLVGQDRIEDYMLELEQQFPRAHVCLQFLFVRDPLRLHAVETWPYANSAHPLSLALQEHLDHAGASIRSTYEACYLVVGTKEDDGLHHEVLNRIKNVFSEQIISPCTWMEYDEEMARPATDVDPMPSKAARAMSFPKLVDAIGPSIPWRMRFKVDINHPLAVKIVRSERRKDKLLRLLGARSRMAPAYQELMDEHNFTWVVCDLKIETWGETTEQEQKNYIHLYGVLSDGSFKRALDYPVMQLDEAISLMPIYRPGSPWSLGELRFQTRDRKPFPYTQKSSMRYVGTDLVFAKDADDIEAYRLAADVGLIASSLVLPQMARIQIGHRTDPLHNLVSKEATGASQGLVSQLTAAADGTFCVNIFDTPLGYAYPFSEGGEACSLVMSMFSRTLIKHYGAHAEPLLKQLITAAYAHVSADGHPKPYIPGFDKVVDADLELICRLDYPATWWGVTDLLLRHKRYESAILAQRHAVPVMADLVTVLRTDMVVRARWERGQVCETSGLSADRFADRLDSLISVWPTLSAPTELPVRHPKLAMTITVVADRTEVAEKVNCLTSALYLLARKAVCSDYFSDSVRYGNSHSDEASMYDKYHADLLHDGYAKGLIKKITYSGMEKVMENAAASGQILYDIRESRKFGVLITLESLKPFESSFYRVCGSTITLSPEKISKEDLSNLPPAQVGVFAPWFNGSTGGLNVSIYAYLKSDHHSLQQNLVLPLEGILSRAV